MSGQVQDKCNRMNDGWTINRPMVISFMMGQKTVPYYHLMIDRARKKKNKKLDETEMG